MPGEDIFVCVYVTVKVICCVNDRNECKLIVIVKKLNAKFCMNE